MRLFNLSCLLSLLVGLTFPILQMHYYTMYRELGITIPGITMNLLSPWVPGIILFATLIRIWIHANIKDRNPTRIESVLVIAAIVLFLIIAAMGFAMAFIRTDGPLGKYSG
jgi:hypothetical protein